MNANSLRTFAKLSTHLSRTVAAALALAIVFVVAIVATPAVQAQHFTVIHDFTGGVDGGYPITGLTMDAAGKFYGTTGGYGHRGSLNTVFELKHSGSAWVFSTLYRFNRDDDGYQPYGRVAIARDGTLYGTTYQGGGSDCEGYGCGTVFHLTPSPPPPKAAVATWNETVLYRFTGGNDGATPQGDLTLDQSGSIYGTAPNWGRYSSGSIFKLSSSGGGWTETVLYSPHGDGDGGFPTGGVVFDGSGNLYGVLEDGGQYGNGAVYKLSPTGTSWTEHLLHSFSGSDGRSPFGGLIMDRSGNLYGTTVFGGSGDAGTVFELTPTYGDWIFTTLYVFPGPQNWGPVDKLVMDSAGNLYGTAENGGAGREGTVFKLTPSIGDWMYTSLHDFTNGSDGAFPECSLIFDADGNLYGTAMGGGAYGYGVVFEITP